MTPSIDGALTPGEPDSAARPGVWLTDLSLLLMATIWGVNFTVVKYGTQVVSPLAFNSARVALAALTLLLMVRFSGAPWPSRRDALMLLALGVIGNGLYQVCFVEGVARTRAGDAALLIAASPAFIAILGAVSGVERASRRAVLGIALSIAGIGFVVMGATSGRAGSSTLLGNAFILAGSLCWSVFAVLLKPITHRVSGITVSALTMVGGAVPLALVAIPEIAVAPWARMPAMGWMAVAYSGLGALVLAYIFWSRGMRILGPTRTAMYSNLQPVIAVLVAWIALGEVPTGWQALGAGSVMSGLFLTRT